jgi:uncharacterized membrane protein
MTLQQLITSAWPARAVTVAIAFCVTLAMPSLANAELKLCNSTSSRIGVAIGYKDKEGWVSEGWWNVDSQSCALYAFDYDKGGEWGGTINMCTNDVEFTIKGIDNCDSRGFKKSGFFEVDTQEQIDWTVKLTDQSDPSQAPSTTDNSNQTQAPSQAAVTTAPGSRHR